MRKFAFVSIILSFLIGGAIGIIRYANIPVLSKVLAFIVEVVRNLPLLLIIFFTYFALPELMHHAQVINAQSQKYIIPIFIFVAIMYFVVNYALSIIARRLEDLIMIGFLESVNAFEKALFLFRENFVA